MERKKFKIMYPKDHFNKELAGKPYTPPQGSMLIMSNGGVFFILYDPNGYDTFIQKLSDVLFKYDVVWK